MKTEANLAKMKAFKSKITKAKDILHTILFHKLKLEDYGSTCGNFNK